MPFAALFSISPESSYYLRDEKHNLVLPQAYFYTGEMLAIFNSANSHIIVGSILVDISKILQDEALSIRVRPREGKIKYQSMVVKAGITKPLPLYPDIKVGVSEVFKV